MILQTGRIAMGMQRTACFALAALALIRPAVAGGAEFGTAQEA
jgi:hypothetical protein